MKLPFSVLTILFVISSCGNDSSGNSEIPEAKAKPETEIKTETNKAFTEEKSTFRFPAEVRVPGQKSISSKVSGKLEKGFVSLKEGTKFSKGDVLFAIDNTEAYARYAAAKKSFKAKLENPEGIPAEHSQLIRQFANNLSPTALLPAFPDLPSAALSAPRMIEIREEYERVSQLESDLKNYFILAETDGVIVAVNRGPGNKIAAGETVIVTGSSVTRIIKVGKGTIVPEQELELYDQNGRLVVRLKAGDLKNTKLKLPPNLKTGKGYYLLPV